MSNQRNAGSIDRRFIDRMRNRLGEEATAFFSALERDAPVSILLNPAKNPQGEFAQSQQVPWCANGRYLEERPEFTFDPLFHAGCYYVMEASSMFLYHVLSSLLAKDRPVTALDLCGAPGGKSVVALSSLPRGSLLVSNEVIKSRFQTLQYNIDKWGAPNVIRTCLDPARIPWTGLFDLIIVDAPCSGEGLFRKDKDARAEWSPEAVQHCSARQKRILVEAERLLAPGGMLIYSTCTYSDEENMHQVQWMTKQFSFISKPVPVQDDWNITQKTIDENIGYQFYPHQVRGEGFFCAVMEKAQNGNGYAPSTPSSRGHKPIIMETARPTSLSHWINPDMQNGASRIFESIDGEYYMLQSAIEHDWLREGLVRYPGTELGIGKSYSLASSRSLIASSEATLHRRTVSLSHALTFSPSNALALSNILHPDTPSVELTRDQAIVYLRKDPLNIACEVPGWNVARYKGFVLGWLKQTQAGMKNYLPTKYRIVKQTVRGGHGTHFSLPKKGGLTS